MIRSGVAGDGGGTVRHFWTETEVNRNSGRGRPQSYPLILSPSEPDREPFLARNIHREKACTYLLYVLLDLYYLSGDVLDRKIRLVSDVLDRRISYSVVTC